MASDLTLAPASSISAAARHEAQAGEAAWLALLDELYGLIESDDTQALFGLFDPGHPLLVRCAAYIGARAICVGTHASVSALNDAKRRPTGWRPQRLVGRPPTHPSRGPWVWAQCANAQGFDARQERDFHTLCAQLHRAFALQDWFGATRARIADRHAALDALPFAIALIDGERQLLLLNRTGRDWSAQGARLAIHERRLYLPHWQAEFEAALRAFVNDASRAQQALHLDALDVALKKLPPEDDALAALPPGIAAAPCRVLLLIRARCDPKQLDRISLPPGPLAESLRDTWQLTEKELGLAWNLAQGMALKHYAALSERSLETVRAQLKSVFRKLGVVDQAGIGVHVSEALLRVSWQALGQCLAAEALDQPGSKRHPSQAPR